MGIDAPYWMNRAYELAQQAQSQGEVPVGAVLVSEDNVLLGAGYNQMIKRHDPSAHAEIIAIREAGMAKQNYRLNGCHLFVTLEPCPMCAYAMVQARLRCVFFATRDKKTGAAGSVYHLLSEPSFNHQVMVEEGLMQAPCSALLTAFFRARRRR